MESQASAEAPQRRKLNLKPRDETAASKAETERKSARSNPFGAAKPRETVLAAKLGKKEEDILKEELSKDKFSLRLTPDQNDQKQAAELAVKEAQDELEAETDTEKKDALKAEIADRQEKLTSLVSGFEKLAVEKAKSGGGMRPSERRAQQLQQQGSGGYGEGAPGGYGQQGAAYGGQQGGQRGYGGPEPRGFDYGNARGRPGGSYDQPPGQSGGSRGGGYDNYAPDAQQSQSFGTRGSGGFDNYNSKGGQSGGRRGRDEGGSFGGGGGGYEGSSFEAPASEYSSPYTQDRF